MHARQCYIRTLVSLVSYQQHYKRRVAKIFIATMYSIHSAIRIYIQRYCSKDMLYKINYTELSNIP